MSPDDPRHGQPRGYGAGCRQECCLRAKIRYDKRRRWEAHQGFARRVPARGAVRRFQALKALGWSPQRIADDAGLHPSHLRSLHRYPTCYRATHVALAETYERLCMSLPPTSTTAEKHAATKVARCAARNGFAPPLAWDDIDCDDAPTCLRYLPANRADAIRDLADLGVGITEACRRLHLSRSAVERYCQRNGLRAEYERLAKVERVGDNQYVKEAS